MAVLRLVQNTNDETIEVLECMLALARRGELRDFLATYRRKGVEKRAYTGLYRQNAAAALRAAFRMSIALTALEQEVRGEP